MIYLDNCSTTHTKPKCVIRAIKKGLTSLNYNPGRAGYSKAIEANMEVLKLRESACRLFNCNDPSNVIITKGCTESLNIALRSNVKQNGHIISTIFEHNSVLRTLEHLKNTYNIGYTLLTPNKEGKIEPNAISSNIKDNTYMVVINHISNVTGTKQDIMSIGQICKTHNLIFVVDGAQSAGHTDLDMTNMNINFLAIAGHKGTLGPQGIGLLLCNKATPKPLLYGGTGTFSSDITQPTDLPEGIESGTMSISNIMGLHAGIEYVHKHSQRIHSKINNLTHYLMLELSKIPNIKIYSPKDSIGVVSINVNNLTSNELSIALDQYKILTRSGLHCAPKVHEFYNTLDTGMTRIGLSHYNTTRHIKKLIKVLKEVSKKSIN